MGPVAGNTSGPEPTSPPADGYGCTIERTMAASAEALYRAWIEGFDTWFATPGAVSMDPRVGQPYWFEVVHEGRRHPHYGRFLALEPGRLIEQTWVSGQGGTGGAETVVRVELSPLGPGARMVLTHDGFTDEESARRHQESWPHILAHLDEMLAPGR